jgi:hypothetical protein
MDKIEGYKKELLTVDLMKANLYGAVAIVPVMAVYAILFYLLWHDSFSKVALRNFIIEHNLGIVGNTISILLIMTIGIIAHELIHGITWAGYAKNGFKSIKFGVLWKMLTPYCHCSEPLKVKHYIIGAVMPAVILGFLPFIYSLFTGNILWLFWSIFFTISAVGDFLIVKLLIKEKKDDLVLDHPSEVGCFIYRKDK